MEYPYFKGLEADRYSFYRVPKALVKADLFQKMSGDAKLLYAVLLDRMSLSIKNGWQDKHGNAYIICTIEEVMDSIHCARQKAVKLLDELEHEFRLIERRRQGLCKPNLLYVKDLYAGLSQSNYWKYENHTSGGMKNELQGVPKSNGSNARNKNVIVIGGSGSGKTRFYVKPNLMQMPQKVSYVVTDPKGTIIIECGKMLSDAGYKIKVLNTINFKKSMRYNLRSGKGYQELREARKGR